MTNDSALALANCLAAIERHELTLDEYIARHPDQRGMLTELAPLAHRLRAAPRVLPSPDFRVEARQHLIAQLPPRRARRSGFAPWPQRPALMRALAVLLVLIVLGSSVVAASAQSLPNEVLYPVKLTVEQVRLALSPDELTRSELSLGFAGERLSEVQRLIDRGQGDETAEVLDAFAGQIQSAAEMARSVPASAEREALLARLQTSIDRSEEVLISSEAKLPTSVQPAVQRARAALRVVPDTPQPTSTPTPTPTSTPVPTSTARPPASATRVPPVTVTPRSRVLPTLRSTRHAPTQPAPSTIHWPTIIPTSWLTALPTFWPTPIATWRPTLVPPILPTRLPHATIGPGTFPTWPSPGTPRPTPIWPTPRKR